MIFMKWNVVVRSAYAKGEMSDKEHDAIYDALDDLLDKHLFTNVLQARINEDPILKDSVAIEIQDADY